MLGGNPLLRGAILFTGALVGGAMPGVAVPLDKLIEGMFGHLDAQKRRDLQDFAEAMAMELATVGPRDDGTRNAVCLKIEEALRTAPLSHSRLLELDLDPDRATAELADHFHFANAVERAELEQHCRNLAKRYYKKMLDSGAFLQELLPRLSAVQLRRHTAHDRKLDAILERLEQDEGIPHAALIKHLVKLGADPRIDQTEVPAFLERFAEEFVAVREQWTRATNADPGIAAAREEALALLNTGELDGARQLFRTTRARIHELRQEKAREEAMLLADEASVDRIDLRYRDAAALLAEAADLTAFDPETSWQHRLSQADMLRQEALDSKNCLFIAPDPFFSEAVTIYEQALELAPRDVRPDDWAITQTLLGNVLQNLGERSRGTVELERAATAYERALEEWTRERLPSRWAMLQNSLGNALRTSGERQHGTATLGRAVKAYELTLQEWTRDHAPRQWATTQNNLGSALRVSGERQHDTATLERAVNAYELALEEWTRDHAPRQWATTQNNLGSALAILGDRNKSTATLERAVAAFKLAFEEFRWQSVPQYWAIDFTNSGGTLLALVKRERGAATLASAVEAYNLEFTGMLIALTGRYVELVLRNQVQVERRLT